MNEILDEEYKCGPGKCVIINNMVFKKGKNLQLLGQKDENNLKLLFVMLGFEVEVHQNLTTEMMKETIESYSKMKHDGAFVLVILSHGNKNDTVSGTDDDKVDDDKNGVQVATLESYFHDQHPSLHGVPKIFIIDACRGRDQDCRQRILTSKDNPHDMHAHIHVDEDSLELENPTITNVAECADFLIIYASARNKKAWGDKEVGSFFTEAFTSEMFKAKEDDDLHKILLRVKRNVLSKPESDEETQTGEDQSRLMKYYYIKRYYYCFALYNVVTVHINQHTYTCNYC